MPSNKKKAAARGYLVCEKLLFRVGRKNKLKRFAENQSFDHLFQYGFQELQDTGFPLKGKWNTQFFKNDHPIVLELGCGKGEYTVGLAKARVGTNHIGFDIKGARMWKGLKESQLLALKNVAFVRTRIELINYFFEPDEVSEIWITFPDPQPQSSRVRKRLTSPVFLAYYRKFMKADGIIHLKTDSQLLYDYTLEVIEEEGLPMHYHTNDLYATTEEMEVKNFRTFYEQMWLEQGISIKYIQFGINPIKG